MTPGLLPYLHKCFPGSEEVLLVNWTTGFKTIEATGWVSFPVLLPLFGKMQETAYIIFCRIVVFIGLSLKLIFLQMMVPLMHLD